MYKLVRIHKKTYRKTLKKNKKEEHRFRLDECPWKRKTSSLQVFQVQKSIIKANNNMQTTITSKKNKKKSHQKGFYKPLD